MPDHDQKPSRNAERPNGRHDFSAARDSKGSSPKNVPNLGDHRRSCSQPHHCHPHPPDSLPVVKFPNCLVFVSTERLIQELLKRSDSCVILRYREQNDLSCDLEIFMTPNLSTPDDLVGMIDATLETFLDTGDPK